MSLVSRRFEFDEVLTLRDESFTAVAKYPTCSVTTPLTIPELHAIVRVRCPVRIAGESFRTLSRSGRSNIEEQALFVVNRTKHDVDQGLLRSIDQTAATRWQFQEP